MMIKWESVLFTTNFDILNFLKSSSFRDLFLFKKYFGPRVYPKGSLVIALVRVSACVCQSVFKYLRDRLLVFSNFLHEVRAP